METTRTPSATPQTAFAHRVHEREAGACRLLILPTEVRGAVTLRGSFLALPAFEEGEELVQELAVAMLDRGTRRRDRFAVAEVLEGRGAELRFSGDGLRVRFRGRMLRRDLPDVLDVLAEQLREPLFDADEFAKAKAQLAARVHRSQESTAAQASGALSRVIYSTDHPNYIPDPQRDLERLMALERDDVEAYHRRHFGGRGLLMALVGDLAADEAEAALPGGLRAWPAASVAARFAADAHASRAERVEVPMPDKDNADVRLGHALPLRRDHPDYLPLYLGVFILGGNFSARLMSTIRDEQGLTYGIRSNLSGVTTEHGGHWQTAVTLSTENLARGVAATRAELDRFVEGGVTAGEVAEKQTTVTGSYRVGLATTGGLAGALLRNAERGFDIGYLDRFPALVEALAPEQVNEAVRRHLHPDRLHLAVAGSVG